MAILNWNAYAFKTRRVLHRVLSYRKGGLRPRFNRVERSRSGPPQGKVVSRLRGRYGAGPTLAGGAGIYTEGIGEFQRDYARPAVSYSLPYFRL